MNSSEPRTPAPPPPDWNLVPFEVGCARCGYDLRGQTEPRCPACALVFDWAEAVPIEKLVCRNCKYHLLGLSATRCPECGEDFTWEQILDDYHRSRKPIFEYRWRNEPIRSLVRTWWLALRPWKLWRMIDLHDPPRIGPLVVMAIVAAMILALAVTVPVIARDIVDYLEWAAMVRRQGRSGTRFIFSIWDSIGSTIWQGRVHRVTLIASLWAGLSFAALLIFQQSMRRGRIRLGHVFRAWVLTVVATCPCAALLMIPTLLGERPYWFSRSQQAWLRAGVPTMVLILMSWAVCCLWTAYRRYLRMPHALGVAAASQTIAVLLTAVICVMLFLHG